MSVEGGTRGVRKYVDAEAFKLIVLRVGSNNSVSAQYFRVRGQSYSSTCVSLLSSPAICLLSNLLEGTYCKKVANSYSKADGKASGAS